MNKIKKILITLLFLPTIPVTAQVLWSDNFDSYTTGSLTNDPTGQTPGKGGWYAIEYNSEIKITNVAGKGNVVAWGWVTGEVNEQINLIRQINLKSYWNNRNLGNDVLKFEYEMFAENFTVPNNSFNSDGAISTISSGGFLHNMGIGFRVNTSKSIIKGTLYTYPTTNLYEVNYNNNWVKVETYFKYDNINSILSQYIYIASLNYLAIKQQTLQHADWGPDRFSFWFDNNKNTQMAHAGALIMYDNFKLSAIPSLPSYLNVTEFLADKFNLYPNPATNVVNITNSEDMAVQQISVYDIAGKQLSIQSFNNETEIQLNVENLASGTYMLHVETAQGTAVKKLVKK